MSSKLDNLLKINKTTKFTDNLEVYKFVIKNTHFTASQSLPHKTSKSLVKFLAARKNFITKHTAFAHFLSQCRMFRIKSILKVTNANNLTLQIPFD